jgi:hypothetical protein
VVGDQALREGLPHVAIVAEAMQQQHRGPMTPDPDVLGCAAGDLKLLAVKIV